MKIGLVYEGGSDHALLKELFSHLKSPSGNSIEIIPIQPIFDATSNRAELGGWTEIRKWCRKYSNKGAAINSPDLLERKSAQLYWKALLPLSSIKTLMIQIDTDIAHNKTNLPKSLNDDFGGNKKEIISKTNTGSIIVFSHPHLAKCSLNLYPTPRTVITYEGIPLI